MSGLDFEFKSLDLGELLCSLTLAVPLPEPLWAANPAAETEADNLRGRSMSGLREGSIVTLFFRGGSAGLLSEEVDAPSSITAAATASFCDKGGTRPPLGTRVGCCSC